MKNKPTITIGIPAHNEEKNISNLLESVLGQKGNFLIKTIYVVCDGCSDQTVKIAANFRTKTKLIKVINSPNRLGKMKRLNQIYSLNTSDYLFTFDADIVLSNNKVIENMVRKFRNNKSVVLVAAHQIPIMPDTFTGKILYTSNRIWEEVRIGVNDGDHIHNLQGSATALSKILAKHIHYPSTLTTDQNYLYLMAQHYGKFAYCKDAEILYRSTQSIYDFRLQASRSIYQDKKTIVEHFGHDIIDVYQVPLLFKIRAISKIMLHSPILTTLAILLNIYVRINPRKDKGATNKKWEMVQSTKLPIDKKWFAI
ncbi:glycosyltransferase family 2 protein [Candidatus Woesebacteria bacterium]|nr:MAG: glycosyltransferase family 2 protein [Candidatus Woesebacteria bacterium]